MKIPKVYRPTREQLGGYSLSEFKTMLKRSGHKVRRDFWRNGYVTQKGQRLFRWRWWSDFGFEVDVSEHLCDFDRWANSVEYCFTFDEYLQLRLVNERVM